VWQQLPSLVPGVSGWPYHLQIARANQAATDPLHPDEAYDARLVATAEQLSSRSISPKYFYLLDSTAPRTLTSCTRATKTNGGAQGPPLDEKGAFPTTFTVMTQQVTPPFGADTALSSGHQREDQTT